MPRFLIWIGGIFGSIGAVLIAISTVSFVSDQRHAAIAKTAEGTVINLTRNRGNDSTTFAPVVEWRDDKGIRRVLYSSTGSNPPAFDRGERVSVLYDPENPEKARINSFGQRHAVTLILGAMGFVFGAIGGTILYLYAKRRSMIARLKRSGERIEAKFMRCEPDISTVINGRNPYRVHAQGIHPKTGRLASFVSGPIFIDLTDTLEGQTVPVLVDRRRYRDHYIVLDEWVADEERA